MINEIQRLHLYSGDHVEEPPYLEILTSDIWSMFDTPHRPARFTNQRTLYNRLEEIRLCNSAGLELERHVTNDPAVLSRLNIVSMGDLTNLTWRTPGIRETARLTAHPDGKDYRPLPHLLINLPNVKHVCQTNRDGPHALMEGVYRPSHPPAVFTYHCNLPYELCTCTEDLGPIVLGAINRHYYTCVFAVDHMPFVNPWGVMQDSVRIEKIVQRLHCLVISLKDGEQSMASEADGDVDLGSTTLELYDYVRYRATPPDGRPKLVFTRGQSLRASQPAATMAPFQALLEKALPKRWKGRVVLKDREDAPPCTACGLNIKEQWDYTVDLMGHANRNVGRCEDIHP